MKNHSILFFYILLFLISYKKEDFSPSYSASAFSLLDSAMILSMLEMIPKEEIGMLNSDWSFHGWDTLSGRIPILEGRTFRISRIGYQ
jgi:hypothetical protein